MTLKVDSIKSLDGREFLKSTGNVLQVKSKYFPDTFTTTSVTSFVDITGFSVSLVPSSSSNKVLVLGHVAIGTGASGASSIHRIACNNVEIYPNNPSSGRYSGWIEYLNLDNNVIRNSMFVYLHSPGSTSQQLYLVQCKCNDSGYTTTINRSYGDTTGNGYSMRTASSITVMEIVA